MVRMSRGIWDLLGVCCPGCAEPGPVCRPCRFSWVGSEVRWSLSSELGLNLGTLGPYAPPASGLIVAWKDQGRTVLDPIIAEALSCLMAAVAIAAVDEDRDIVWLPIPARSRDRRRRGGDLLQQAVRSAMKLRGNRPQEFLCVDLGWRKGTPDLVGVPAPQRFALMRDALSFQPLPGLRRRLASGADLILIDDIVTTGATLRAAQAACQARGYQVSAAVSLARTIPNSAHFF